jgi:hypothetical protein
MVELCYDALEALHHGGHAAIKVVSIGGQGNRIYYEFVGADGSKDKIGASGVKSNDGSLVVSVHSWLICVKKSFKDTQKA